MTTRSRTLALCLAAMMVTTTVVFLAPAATAQDFVPTKPEVPLTVAPGIETRLYLRYPNVNEDQVTEQPQPDCGGLPTNPNAPRLTIAPAPPNNDGSVGGSGRSTCGYGAGAVVTFTTQPKTATNSMRPLRDIHLTGNGSIRYFHMGTVFANVPLEVSLISGDSTTIANGTFLYTPAPGAPQSVNEFDIPLRLQGVGADTGRQTIFGDRDLVIKIKELGQPPPVPLPTPTWRVADTGSHLRITTDDAYRAATWVTDERSNLRTVFSPIANESQLPQDQDRRIVGHFALQSAFGYGDASRGDPARFRVYFGGSPREIGQDGANFLDGGFNNSASAPSNGTAVWSFPSNSLKYNGFPGGEYSLRVEKRHHLAGGSAITAGIERGFAIAAQSIDLRVFTDTRSGVSETQAHTITPGGSTTYLLQVFNTGSVNDTYSINLTAPNPPSGWNGLISGPDVQGGDRIFVPRGESRVFTLTVNAPQGATGQIIHLVNVTSTLDPGFRSRDLTIVTSVGTDLVRDVSVVFLARNLEVEPSVDTTYPVYVWNRGTRPTNISLELKETSSGAWTTDLISGGNPVDRVVVGGVQPGGISPVTLRIRGDSAASPTHTIRLNATQQDASTTSREVPITFSLRVTNAVSIRVLDTIGGHGHVAQLQDNDQIDVDGDGTPDAGNPACATPQADCTDDGVTGLWYRIWVTNNGRTTDTFTLSAELFDSSCSNTQNPSLEPETNSFFFRAPGVSPAARDQMTLDAGETGEIYYLLNVDRKTDPCGSSTVDTETLDFVVMATGTTGAIARQALKATATSGDDSRAEAVLIEPVARLTYTESEPLVDIGNSTKRSIVGGIRPGGVLEYYVRITNAAGWSNFTDSNGNTIESDLRLKLDGVALEEGWNVSMRPVVESTRMNENDNPFKRELNLSVFESGTLQGPRRGWVDQEIQVRVQAPSIANGTAVTNAQDTVFLLATMNNSNTVNSLEIVTIVTDFAEVRMRTDVGRVFAHAGDPSSFLLYLNNTGGSETPVTMRARPLNAPAGWTVEPNADTFSLAAFKNRTIALRVTPPAGAPVGSSINVEVNVSYAEFPRISLNQSKVNTTTIPIQVVGPGSLQLITGTTDSIVAPGGFANFTMTVRNTGSFNMPFRVTASDIPNWTITAAPEFGNLTGGESRQITLVARVPNDVTNESRFSSIVRVEELNAALGSENFDTAAFTVNILGGRAIPSISVPNLVKRVDRGGSQSFEVAIRNVGSAAGVIPLEIRALDPTWSVVVRNSADASSQQISNVRLSPNELVNVYVNVSAPLVVPERAVVPIEIAAYTPDLTQRATATLSAEVHDYGVALVLAPSSKDGLPGVATEFVARVRNTGNDNDTLNLSVNLADLPAGWNVDHVQEVRLEPNQETEIRMTFRSPNDPLPTPRAYTFPVWVGTRGGQAVNITKNMSQSAVITIPNYRAFDMDGDTQLEVAVDVDKRTGNGFEEFREIFATGSATREIGKPILDGRTTFLLDVPTAETSHDGRADVWFNPETVHAFDIEFSPDINGDGTPDYLLDTDRDGKIDRAYDSVTERFWNVVEVKVYGDDEIQYLVDVTGDGRPDRFFDPDAEEGEGRVTRTQSGGDLGAEFVGIDVDDDQTVDYYYNTRTEDVSGAEVQNLGGFAQRYWYFFVAFLALVLVSVLLIVRRRR